MEKNAAENDHSTETTNGEPIGRKPGILLRTIGRILPIYQGASESFFVNINNKRMVTNNFIALILIEKADLIFAIDSIPAVLTVTQETFTVFTSNIFAIIGLRSFYCMFAKMMDEFIYMKYGLAWILAFIGCKMILSMQQIHISNEISLLAIFSAIISSVCFSIYNKKRTNVLKNDIWVINEARAH